MEKLQDYGSFSTYSLYVRFLQYIVMNWMRYEDPNVIKDSRKLSHYNLSITGAFKAHIEQLMRYYTEVLLRAFGFGDNTRSGVFTCILASAIVMSHDFGKMVGSRVANHHDLLSIWTQNKISTPEDREFMKKHVSPKYREIIWRRLGVDYGTVPGVIEFPGQNHHRYQNGGHGGYPKKEIISEEYPHLVKLLGFLLLLVDQAEAALSELRLYKDPIDVSVLVDQFRDHMQESRVKKSVVQIVNSMLIDNGGIALSKNVISFDGVIKRIWDENDIARDFRYYNEDKFQIVLGQLELKSEKLIKI